MENKGLEIRIDYDAIKYIKITKDGIVIEKAITNNTPSPIIKDQLPQEDASAHDHLSPMVLTASPIASSGDEPHDGLRASSTHPYQDDITLNKAIKEMPILNKPKISSNKRKIKATKGKKSYNGVAPYLPVFQ